MNSRRLDVARGHQGSGSGDACALRLPLTSVSPLEGYLTPATRLSQGGKLVQGCPEQKGSGWR